MFHGDLDYFQKPSLGDRPNIKPGDHNRWVILFYLVWGPHMKGNFIEIAFWVRVQSHICGPCIVNKWMCSYIFSLFLIDCPCNLLEGALVVDGLPRLVCKGRFTQGPSLKGHFTHKPRVVTMKLWEPKRHIQYHVVWSWALKCIVKSYATRPSTKCYFNEFLFMQGFYTW